MGPRTDILVSLGKSVAQIAADFSPIPALGPATELLCEIISLCENVAQNRQAARQLRDRCHSLLRSLRENEPRLDNKKMIDAINAVHDCLLDIKTRMHGWSNLGTLQSFSRQTEIQDGILDCHNALVDCMTRFQLASHIQIHDWQMEFTQSTKNDYDKVMKCLSEAQALQGITNEKVDAQGEGIRQLMVQMQQLLSKQKKVMRTAGQMHVGISGNLYDLQMWSGTLLPDLELKSGEVERIGDEPVSGTPTMDIWEGLYLGREKVAIKIIRSVSLNETNLRRFRREVETWHRVHKIDGGRHIQPFYGYCLTDGAFPYMVSPWQANGNALSYVRTNARVDHRRLIKGIAQGLQVLHAMNPPLVHGDLKAQNVVIDRHGSPLIADFGLSKIVADLTGAQFTQSSGVADSHRWFAPEVCFQSTLSTKSDVYSYGMTVFELMTHERPFSNINSTSQVIVQIHEGERPVRVTDHRVVERGLDDELWRILTTCWDADPGSRPTMLDLIAKLQ